MRRISAVCLAMMVATLPALAFEPAVPGGVVTAMDVSPADSVRMPNSPWTEGAAVPEVEGAIRRRAIRAGGSTLTTLQLLAPLRDALVDAGFEIVFDCADAVCGGFDFRFQLDILGEPDMHVDLGDFRYLLARRPEAADGEARAVSIVVSRSGDAGWVHITEVFTPEEAPETAQQAQPARNLDDGPVPRDGFGETLLDRGHIVLTDLDFGSGASDLSEAPYASLAALAEWLAENTTARVAIVGHTDGVGSLEANIALSRRRAETVRARLVDRLGVEPGQVVADGAGYLAPVASNGTEAGRAANRRVEVVLLGTGP